MRAREFLFEAIATTLTPNDLTKHGPGRFNTLISMIMSGQPLYKVDGTPITINPAEANRLKELFSQGQFVGRVALLGTDGQQHPLSTFLKTTEFGGKSVPPDQSANGQASPDVQGTAVRADIKPSRTFQYGATPDEQNLTADVALQLNAFRASELGERIANNQYLDTQGRVGAAVKQISREISAGQLPVIPELTTPELNEIQKYGFEYLGVQEVVDGVADFPNEEDFYEHVGTDLSNLILYFPQSAGNPLADSFVFQNSVTENAIYISSKAEKGGAPSSIMGLKIPSQLQKKIKSDPALEFLNLLQTSEAWRQPFNAANYLSTKYPGSMGKLEKFLPFDDTFLNYLKQTWDNQRQGVPSDISQIPRKYQPVFKLVQASVDKKADNPLFYDIRLYVKTVVQDAIRAGTIKNFNRRMLEVLGFNFIVLTTNKKGKPGVGHFVTSVKWPAGVNGKVTLEHKDPAPKWTASMTWKLT